jgi:enamine deaminase RidA (YjgF/YER057c/UK114 family)
MIRRTSPEVENFLTSDVFEGFGFSQIVTAGDTVHIAGVVANVGSLHDLQIVHPGDTAKQLEFILRVIEDLLRTEGLDRTNLVSLTIYASDLPALTRAIPQVYVPWVGEHAPNMSIVQVPGFLLEGQVLEIPAIAYRG